MVEHEVREFVVRLFHLRTINRGTQHQKKENAPSPGLEQNTIAAPVPSRLALPSPHCLKESARSTPHATETTHSRSVGMLTRARERHLCGHRIAKRRARLTLRFWDAKTWHGGSLSNSCARASSAASAQASRV